MHTSIVTSAELREALKPLRTRHLKALALRSGVPWETIYKIKTGVTANPGVDTVNRFLPHVAAVRAGM